MNKDLHPEKNWLAFFSSRNPGLAYFPLISKLLFALSGSWSEIRVLKQRLSLFPTPTCSFLCNSPGTKLLYLSSGDTQFLIFQMFQMSKKSKLSSATSAGYTLYLLLLKSKLGNRKLWKELKLVDICVLSVTMLLEESSRKQVSLNSSKSSASFCNIFCSKISQLLSPLPPSCLPSSKASF